MSSHARVADLLKLRKAELIARCRRLGLDTSGLKLALAERLANYDVHFSVGGGLTPPSIAPPIAPDAVPGSSVDKGKRKAAAGRNVRIGKRRRQHSDSDLSGGESGSSVGETVGDSLGHSNVCNDIFVREGAPGGGRQDLAEAADIEPQLGGQLSSRVQEIGLLSDGARARPVAPRSPPLRAHERVGKGLGRHLWLSLSLILINWRYPGQPFLQFRRLRILKFVRVSTLILILCFHI